MRNEKVFEWLSEKGFADRVIDHTETIDTVEHAAIQLGCSEAEIAKTQFHTKPSMIPRDHVEKMTGSIPGGVCPFAVPSGIPVWLDVSMKRFFFIHPSAGNEFTSVKLTPDELEQASNAVGWCDVCKGWE